MRPEETDVNRIRWLIGNPLTRWIWRMTGFMWFRYIDEHGRRRWWVGPKP